MKLQLAKAAYSRGQGARIPLLNMLFEGDPRNVETQFSVIQRPGTAVYATCGDGPVRGVYREDNVVGGLAFVVSGGNLYKIATDGTVTQIGSNGAITGSSRVIMAGDASKVFITTGTTLYSTDGSTITTWSFPDSAGVTSVARINGYFLFSRAATHRFYWLIPGSSSIGALDFASAENAPDVLQAVRTLGDQLWMFGSGTLEAYDPTGDTEDPFLRIGGQLFPVGCLDPDTIAVGMSQLFWVGIDRDSGTRMVYRCAGDRPVKISDAWVEELIRKASDLRGFMTEVEGHPLYCLSTGNETLACDISTGLWVQLKSYGMDQFRGHVSASLADGRSLIGDRVNGTVWVVDEDANLDGAAAIEREFSARLQLDGRLACRNLRLECSTGRGDIEEDPTLSARWSDNNGRTFSDPVFAPLERQGEYGERVVFTRLGLMGPPGRDFVFRCTDDVKLTAWRASVNVDLR